MSDLSKPRETADWIASWRAHYATSPGGAERLARLLRVTADEQAANCRGRWSTPQYRRSVAMLERAARAADPDSGKPVAGEVA